jgi:hypothetical protein
MLLGYAILTQVVKTWFIRALANNSEGNPAVSFAIALADTAFC